MDQIKAAFERGNVILDIEASSIDSVIQQAVGYLVKQGVIDQKAASFVADTLAERERTYPADIGHAASVPHVYLDGIHEQTVLFVRLARPLNLGARDGTPIRFLFFLLGPPGSAARHLDTLAGVARLVSDERFRFEAGEARTVDDLIVAYGNFQGEKVAPPRVESSDGLDYSGKLTGGIRHDVDRRLKHYASDFRDGLQPKCLGATLFLFFACLAPAVTFGGVMAVETNNQIGAVEMIVASAFCGAVFSLIGGQPLIILGGTGPLLVFTAMLFRLCSDLEIAFLPTYAWVGLWSAFFIVFLAVTDASCLMRYFTRFTDETFAALISVIFIYEATKQLVYIFQGLDEHKHHDTALLTLLLALGTFYIAMSLSRIRKSHYLLPKIREFLADFGPAISIAAMTIVAVGLHEVYLETLRAPNSFGTTNGREWQVDLWAAPMWVRLGAIGPAALVTVLVYLDQNITARVINSPDHRLRKGAAYHLDLAVVGGLMGICSLFGLPWLVAATVRSLNHVRSLATVEEVLTKNGQLRERVIFVREQRITGLAIHLLIAMSLVLLVYLKQIPMAVLYGLFLFMGVVSMSGNQFFERLSLWLKDPSLYPVTHYIRRVPIWTIHRFTLLQLVCLSVLWVVKSSAIAILFPIFIALLVPVRMFATRLFPPEHLAALDAEEEPESEELDWSG